jgi:hypothetical protein
VLEAEKLAQTANAPSTPAERRAWVRYLCNQESTCRPLAGARGVPWPGKLCDLSAGGVALRLARRFEIGAMLAIDVRGPSETVLATLFARVAHVSLQSDGGWLLGCAFTNPLNEEDIKALQ